MSYGALSDALIKLLRMSRGPVPRDQILDELYGSCPNAPEDERAALNRTISNLRKRGVDIECVVAFRLRQP